VVWVGEDLVRIGEDVARVVLTAGLTGEVN
jgi:hypothetical protein